MKRVAYPLLFSVIVASAAIVILNEHESEVDLTGQEVKPVSSETKIFKAALKDPEHELSDIPAEINVRQEHMQVTTEERAQVDGTDNSSSALLDLDPSGLTHDQKIEQILVCYRDFQNSLSSGGRDQILAESVLATRCAVAIMRESGRAIYDLDVDDGERRAFRMSPSTPNKTFVAADNAKYIIDLNEFKAVRLSKERNALIGRGRRSEVIPPLQDSELAQYEAIVQQALAALDINSK